MSTLTISTQTLPAPEILSPRPEVREMFDKLKTASKYLKTSLMMIAFWGSRLRACDGFQDLGFSDENECREALGIPQSSWYRFLRVGEALYSLSFDDLIQIPTGNAVLLAGVIPEMMQSYDWVSDAKRLRPQEFAELIVMRNQSAGSNKEPMTYVRFKVPFTAKDAIEEMVDAFADREGLRTRGHALEMLVADTYDRPNIGILMSRISHMLQECVHELGRPNVPDERRLRYVEQLRLIRRLLHEGSKEEIHKANTAAGDEEA